MNILNDRVSDTIKNKYDELYSAEKKVAKYIVDNPQKAVSMNVNELSKASNVSDATVVRMCQHLGFKGFYQMKLLLMKDLGSKEKFNRNLTDEKKNPIEFMKSKKDTVLESINYEENVKSIKNLIRHIQDSKNIYIISAGNTIPLANDLEFRLNRLGYSAFSSQVTEKIINYVINGSKEDLLILISKSGLSKSVLQSCEIANNKKMTTYAITSDISSPLANLAQYKIFSGKESLEYNNVFHGTESHMGEIFINDIVIYFLACILNKEKNDEELNSELEYFSSWKM